MELCDIAEMGAEGAVSMFPGLPELASERAPSCRGSPPERLCFLLSILWSCTLPEGSLPLLLLGEMVVLVLMLPIAMPRSILPRGLEGELGKTI